MEQPAGQTVCVGHPTNPPPMAAATPAPTPGAANAPESTVASACPVVVAPTPAACEPPPPPARPPLQCAPPARSPLQHRPSLQRPPPASPPHAPTPVAPAPAAASASPSCSAVHVPITELVPPLDSPSDPAAAGRPPLPCAGGTPNAIHAPPGASESKEMRRSRERNFFSFWMVMIRFGGWGATTEKFLWWAP